MRENTVALVKQYDFPTTAIGDYCGLPAPRISDYLKNRKVPHHHAEQIDEAVEDLVSVREWFGPLTDVRQTAHVRKVADRLKAISPAEALLAQFALKVLNQVFEINPSQTA